jgi:hypothetical protein
MDCRDKRRQSRPRICAEIRTILRAGEDAVPFIAWVVVWRFRILICVVVRAADPAT